MVKEKSWIIILSEEITLFVTRTLVVDTSSSLGSNHHFLSGRISETMKKYMLLQLLLLLMKTTVGVCAETVSVSDGVTLLVVAAAALKMTMKM